MFRLRTSQTPLYFAHLADSFPIDFPLGFARGCGLPGLRLTGSTLFRLVSSAPLRFTQWFSSGLRCRTCAFLGLLRLAIVYPHGTR